MRTTKRLSTAYLMVATLLIIGIITMSKNVFADSVDFNVTIPHHSVGIELPLTPKTNNNSCAVLEFTGGTISSTSYIWVYIKNSSNNIVSNELCITGCGSYTLDYNSNYGVMGEEYKLCIRTGYYGATLSGRWTP